MPYLAYYDKPMRRRKIMKSNKKHTISTGNVFEDLQMENPQVRLLKAQIAAEIYNIIQSRDLNQKAAASLLKIDQPKISALVNGRLAGFTIDRLVKFLDLLGQEVHLTIKARNYTKKKDGDKRLGK